MEHNSTNIYFLKDVCFGVNNENDQDLLDFAQSLIEGDVVYFCGETYINIDAAEKLLRGFDKTVKVILMKPEPNPKNRLRSLLGDGVIVDDTLKGRYSNFSIVEKNMIFLDKEYVLSLHTVLDSEIKQMTFSTEIPIEYRDRVVSLDRKFWGNTVPNFFQIKEILEEQHEETL